MTDRHERIETTLAVMGWHSEPIYNGKADQWMPADEHRTDGTAILIPSDRKAPDYTYLMEKAERQCLSLFGSLTVTDVSYATAHDRRTLTLQNDSGQATITGITGTGNNKPDTITLTVRNRNHPAPVEQALAFATTPSLIMWLGESLAGTGQPTRGMTRNLEHIKGCHATGTDPTVIDTPHSTITIDTVHDTAHTRTPDHGNLIEYTDPLNRFSIHSNTTNPTGRECTTLTVAHPSETPLGTQSMNLDRSMTPALIAFLTETWALAPAHTPLFTLDGHSNLERQQMQTPEPNTWKTKHVTVRFKTTGTRKANS
jgi:hypothetical protein